MWEHYLQTAKEKFLVESENADETLEANNAKYVEHIEKITGDQAELVVQLSKSEKNNESIVEELDAYIAKYDPKTYFMRGARGMLRSGLISVSEEERVRALLSKMGLVLSVLGATFLLPGRSAGRMPRARKHLITKTRNQPL